LTQFSRWHQAHREKQARSHQFLQNFVVESEEAEQPSHEELAVIIVPVS
jgi:hypothetical protein